MTFDPTTAKKWIIDTSAQMDENEFIEYKNYKWPFNFELNKKIIKTYCSFLNRKGGFLFIGIDDNKIIKGIDLTYKELDVLKNYLLNLTDSFYPKCKKDYIIVYDYDVLDNKLTPLTNKKVIKVQIKQGDPSKLYSIESKIYKSFIRIQGQSRQLEASEIEEEILRRRSGNAHDNQVSFDRFSDDLSIKLQNKLKYLGSGIKNKNEETRSEYTNFSYRPKSFSQEEFSTKLDSEDEEIESIKFKLNHFPFNMFNKEIYELVDSALPDIGHHTKIFRKRKKVLYAILFVDSFPDEAFNRLEDEINYRRLSIQIKRIN